MYDVKVIYFDVVGTLVDWRGSIVKVLNNHPQANEIAEEWVKYYAGGNFKYYRDLVNKGIALTAKYKLEDENCFYYFLNVWSNLQPWSDVLPAFQQLRSNYQLVALTNLTTETVVKLCKNTGLQFDYIFSAELTGKKKPDPIVYQQACEVLCVEPSETLLVAAHCFDLNAAHEQGMHTCYVRRNDDKEPSKDDKVDFIVNDLFELNNV